MNDTPEHIKKLQLEIWLAKPPGERLRLILLHNDELYSFWNEGKKSLTGNSIKKSEKKP